MNWKGKELKGYREIVDMALSLQGTEQEGFVEEYCKLGPAARENMGYISGYYDSETAMRIQQVFNTEHPIFGRRIPTKEEAFNKGIEMGRKNLARDRK